MDGLVARRLSLAATCLLGVTLGCNHTKQTTALPAEPIPVTQLDEAPRKPREPRQPKPDTCVACAEMRLEIASVPERTTSEVAQLRDQARRAYQQALRLDEKHLPAYFGLAKLYEAMEKYDKAVETYQQGLKFHPKHAPLWFELGMCQARHKEWEPALANLKKAVEFDPENFLYVNTLGFCLARAGRLDESYGHFARAVGEAKAHYNIAQVLHHFRRDEECKQHLRQALMAKPDLQPAQQMLAYLQDPNRPTEPIQQAGFSAAPASK